MAETPRGAGILGKKKGPENIRALVIGGGGGSRTRVRKSYVQGYYTVSLLIDLAALLLKRQGNRVAIPGI